MDDFWKFITNFKSVTSWIAKLAILSPWADIIVAVGPLWPSRVAVGVITSVVQAIILIWGFQFWKDISKARKKSRMKFFAASFIVFGVIYLLFLAFLTYPDPVQGRKAKGLVLQPSIAKILSGENQEGVVIPEPDSDNATEHGAITANSVEEILPLVGYEEFKVWQPWSIYLTRCLSVLAWIGVFGSVIGFITAFVLLQSKGE
ncbi:hypothetical protein Pan97_25530 [Bremerella volcania]|uniref:Uncharacterized protein n=1 Tax=Bremerella volcania TaxID=2527984 RepID=A0A518C8I4_9BACT|nr:hypothetical protein [Bremerella volcania]QDU75520.1 hypothetical protein Pan97_25530 [Bremerella volcania]